ncbi:MAG: glycosyltransferase [Bacteroides sp.]|nr:glycosyltransferase [Bacteroides sp.]
MKTLIVSANAFSKVYNNGKTLEAIFGAFQSCELSQLFTRPQDSKYTDYDFCDNYYVVSEVDIIKKIIGQSKTCGSALFNKETNYKSKIYSTFKKKNIKKLSLIRDLLWGINLWKTKELDNWINQQKPDMVFLVGGGAKYLHSLGRYISTKLDIPLLVFYTDDYLLHPKFNGILGKLHRTIMSSHYKKTINSATACFAIGDLMSKEYGEYFKRKFYPIMNSIRLEEYKAPTINVPNIISYFGGLHLNRWKMLCRFSESLPEDWELHVYSSSEITNEIQEGFTKTNIKFLGCVHGDKLQEKMQQSQVLLHVESDDSYNRALTYLSVSTKLPEYLMSGRLVLGFGPQEVASMRLLIDNKIGIGIDSSFEKDHIKSILKDILSNDAKIKQIGKEGYDYACQRFDGGKNAKDFRSYIEKILSEAKTR